MSKSSTLRMAISIELPQRWLWMPPKMALRLIWQAALHASDRKPHPSLVKHWLQHHTTRTSNSVSSISTRESTLSALRIPLTRIIPTALSPKMSFLELCRFI